jgi:hypothetical protein
MVRVRNLRGGALALPLHVIPNPDPVSAEHTPHVARSYLFEGDVLLELEALNALPPGLQSQVIEWVNLGWLAMLPAELPPEPAPADPEPAADDPNALPADDEAALAAIKAETDHSKLDAWFQAAGERLPVSEAILSRLQELDPK